MSQIFGHSPLQIFQARRLLTYCIIFCIPSSYLWLHENQQNWMWVFMRKSTAGWLLVLQYTIVSKSKSRTFICIIQCTQYLFDLNLYTHISWNFTGNNRDIKPVKHYGTDNIQSTISLISSKFTLNEWDFKNVLKI